MFSFFCKWILTFWAKEKSMDEIGLDPLVKVIKQFDDVPFSVANQELLDLFHARVNYALCEVAENCNWDGCTDIEFGNNVYGVSSFKSAFFNITIFKNKKTSIIRAMRRGRNYLERGSETPLYEKSFGMFLSNPYDLVIAISRESAKRIAIAQDERQRAYESDGYIPAFRDY